MQGPFFAEHIACNHVIIFLRLLDLISIVLCSSVADLDMILAYSLMKGITPLMTSVAADDEQFIFRHFGPRVYPLGSIVITLVRPSVRLSVFKYLGDRSLVFSETLHEVRGQ